MQPGVPGTRIDGFQVKGLTVQGFPNNGILTRYLDNFKIERNESIDNLENGIWPTLSANGLVKKNVAYGSEDAALWVEASENVRVLKNDLSYSPTGLEITVSNNILAKGNEVHHNTVGIGLYHAEGRGAAAAAAARPQWRLEARRQPHSRQQRSRTPRRPARCPGSCRRESASRSSASTV